MIARDYDADELENDDDAWDDDPNDDETMPCPHCGEPVFDDAERCPECGLYLSREDAPRHRPWWLWVGVALCLIVVLGWIL